MLRTNKAFTVKNISEIKTKLLIWGNQHKTMIWLDSNHNTKTDKEAFLAIDTITVLQSKPNKAFEKLQRYIDDIKDYAFGFLGYDLKNDIEDLHSNNIDCAGFPDLFFFQPKKLIEVAQNKIIFRYPLDFKKDISKDWEAIKNAIHSPNLKNNININFSIDKQTYLTETKKIIEKIRLGKIYEINYCQEFNAQNSTIFPLDTYLALNKISSAPFASFVKTDGLYLLSASPERFLKKTGNTILSAPIKGTAKRNIDLKKDQLQIDLLKNNTKEIAENIMIVDLVRNDLSHIAQKGTVKVDELCEVYSFKQVHQMVSTISCNLKPKTHAVEAIKACYPMGSMTGAPKIAAMKIIEEVETHKRGIYSGAVGYFTPEQDFDFNVVIRSIVYNEQKKYVSFSVGSAITAKSKPIDEYEECLLKAKAMVEVLT